MPVERVTALEIRTLPETAKESWRQCHKTFIFFVNDEGAK
jgi:hypothetical protein